MMQQEGEILTAHKLKSKTNKVSDYTKKIVKNDTVGEIIQVQGGKIIKATGRKDRHSKVYTAKGPRDRRVRLSANTAIQFYDVQDRLGYDRPSKAIDWLMKKAKDAIDKLEDSTNQDEIKRDQSCSTIDFNSGCSRSVQEFQLQKHESIADSMKSFFPLSPGTSLMEMESYPHERVSRIGIQSEDLGLLLNTQNQDQLLLQGSNSVQFEQNYSNLVGEGENRVGFVFNPHTIPQQLFGSQNSSMFSQREPLQSNYSQNLLHSWNERMLPSLDQQINGQPTLQPCLYNFYFGSNFQGPDQIHGQQENSHSSQI